MKGNSITIGICLTFSVIFAGYEDSLISAWDGRDNFSAKITRTNITFIDTTIEKGVFAIGKPDAIYRTETELVLFTAGTLYTFTSGSDVGLKLPMKDFVYADIGTLMKKLREEFEIGYIHTDSGVTITGKKGLGDITEFTAVLDRHYLPVSINWVDIFGYKVILEFEDVDTGNSGDIFEIPEEIDFILQE